MASGKSLMDQIAARVGRPVTKPLPAGASRDRTLRGKARIKARKAKNRKLSEGNWS